MLTGWPVLMHQSVQLTDWCINTVKDAFAVAVEVSGSGRSALTCFFLFIAFLGVSSFAAAPFPCGIGSGVYVIGRAAPLARSPAQARAAFGLRVDVLLEAGAGGQACLSINQA